MSRTTQPQVKKVVALCAAVACMAAPAAILAQRYPRFVWVWIGFMLVLLIYAGAQFAKLKKGRS